MTPEFEHQLQTDTCRWRRELHRIPEIGFVEYKTADYIRRELDKMGLEWQAICSTGTLVYLNNHKQSTIAFRSDIDALPINEHSGAEFTSEHAGFMHACGHDGHMANLLGFASWVKDHLHELQNNILLIFQPAEETTGGAADIVATGVFEKYQVKCIYGLHLFPDLPQGTLACRAGPMMAQTGQIIIEVEGKSAHAALSYQGIDSLYIATQLVQQYQGILTRSLPAMDSAVLHIGEFNAGEGDNVVAPRAVMRGTIRTFSEALLLTIVEKMKALHQAAEQAYGCKIHFQASVGYPPVINDPSLTQKMEQTFKQQGFTYHSLPEPSFLGEDFSFYQKAIPGVFFYLGTRNDALGFVHGLHNNRFNFEEAVLLQGVKAFIALAKSM